MRYSIAVKFIAFLLCACSLVLAIGCAAGIFFLGESQLYSVPLDTVKQEYLNDIGYNLAWYHARTYAIEEYSDCSESVIAQDLSGYAYMNLSEDYSYSVSIIKGETVLYENHIGSTAAKAFSLDKKITVTQYLSPVYPMMGQEGVEPTDKNYIYSEYYWDQERYEDVQIDYFRSPEIKVTITLPEEAVYSNPSYSITEILYEFRYDMIMWLLVSLLIFAVTLVYLCCAAGRSKGTTDIRPMGLNRLPLDLYAFCVFFGCFGLLYLGMMLLEWALRDEVLNLAGITLAALCALGFSVLCVAFLFAFAAQAKIKNHYWLRHTLIGWCAGKIIGGIRWCFRGCRAMVRMLPLMWQWLLTAFGMVCAVGLTFLLAITAYGIFELFWGFLCFASILGCIAIVCYGAWAFAVLTKGATILAQGNLYYQINTKYLLGCFKDFALQLNSLAGAARIAATNQLKSERMKTELITNVSHDIKTPLTSIINYVDLLQKPHTDEEQTTYLEVLFRQSQRLKKLIDDLLEMSKASTGNMNVEISPVDAVESVNQALGEFADKLEKAQLTPVFRHPEAPVTILADGKLTWRVLSNLLSNAVKYAMPGTRLYLDLMQLEGSVVVSLKNISREELNINAEELMERFVRGDQSRNTEGSGLGLNIAKSLMDLQKGQLQLLVDGDLFKVTLIFPAG